MKSNPLKTVSVLLCFCSVSVLAVAQNISVKVNFNNAPDSASTRFTDLKYNKESVFSLDIDDQPVNVMSILAYFQGGVAPEDGISYPGKYFTDGCGVKRPFAAGIAMTAHSNYNDNDLTTASHLLSVDQLKKLVKAGFGLQNHGFYHEKDGYYITNKFNEAKNIAEGTNFIFEKTGFLPRIWTTPSNHTGYNTYVEEQGYLAATSQGVTDGYTSQPVNMWTDHLADLSQFSPSFNVFLRDFNDDWNNTAKTDELKLRVTGLKNKSSATAHKVYRIGTHSYNANNWNGFKSFIDHIESVSNNTIWVASLQEVLEFLEVKRNVIKTESLSQNVLTINLDLSNVSASNYFRDMTLKVDGGKVSSVEVTGADSFSFNADGLINIYKKNANVSPVPKANKLIVNAGTDVITTLPVDTVLFKGTVTGTDSIASYQWTKVSGGAATITSPSSASTTITGLVQGSYVFRLTVTDNGGAT
ncbi:MAG TPA: hypothetical protein VFQ73_01890, partial [Flavisolibacter sp.]|nr:hypothetical protein [Flavisolibacter sp.]